MTVAALLALLDEIDRQGGPEAARHNCLCLPYERTPEPMSTAPAPRPAPPTVGVPLRADADVHLKPIAQVTEEPAPPPLPVGRLIAWAADQDDKETRAHAEKARESIKFLRARHQAASRLQHLSDEEARLEEQLTALREQKAQLLPKKRAAKSYNAAVVRAWARENSLPVPPAGRVPVAVVDAWRAATTHDSPSA
ncbi:Lsr2 family DNA-binding protein [Streptomyces turgidiscabies]|uniref:Lsr2 family DNA-binding protein n=1 Tax=Streptomyces turgidiscabies TaxID=85558 RepID=UPI0038F6351E